MLHPPPLKERRPGSSIICSLMTSRNESSGKTRFNEIYVSLGSRRGGEYGISIEFPRTENKSPAVPDKKADSSTEQLLLTLMKEVKGLKRQFEIPSGTSLLNSQSSSSKSTKKKTWFGPCKHCGLGNNLTDDCYSKPKCFTCGSTDHLTKEHIEQTAVNKTLTKLKAQSSVSPSTKKDPMIPKPFKECKYCGFNDHHSDNCEY
ncbi:hypothetical protein Tco_0618767 [Tanacetum coccineum]